METDNQQPRLRKWINKNSAAVTAIAVIGIVVAIMGIVRQMKPPVVNRAPSLSYFLDLDSDQLFVAGSDLVPPIHSPGADSSQPPNSVRAYVFACGECGVAENRFISWVEKFSPESQQQISRRAKRSPSDQPDQPGMPFMPGPGFPSDPGHWVAKYDDQDPEWKTKWVLFSSQEGNQVIASTQERCAPNFMPMICRPGNDR